MRKVIFSILIILSIVISEDSSQKQAIVKGGSSRRVNIPYLGSAPPAASFTPAVFWFGNITPTSNYADVRAWYYDDYLDIYINIIDRLLWYDSSPSPQDLTSWDSISIFVKLDGNTGTSPTAKSYRFDAQISDWENPRTAWQAAYQGNGSSWISSNISFTTETGYRYESDNVGGINNNQNNRGWNVNLNLPFASLGLSSKPSSSTVWGLAVIVHDRDDQTGTPIPDQVWPENMQANVPGSWGQMRFGLPGYTPPPSSPEGNLVIRNGLNGMVVKDGEVGGHSTCGEASFPDIFSNWGVANYAGYTQINIQNQWDLADWPCFSKYYITFPLSSIPPGKTIISATISMYLFGGSGGGGMPPDSYIQTFTIAQDWYENTLNWNNAPLAIENMAGTWVHPIPTADWVLYKWDVSLAAAQAFSSGQPLRLAMYSADGERHTGKYFISSYGQDVGRPALSITYGSICGGQGPICHYIFLPAITH